MNNIFSKATWKFMFLNKFGYFLIVFIALFVGSLISPDTFIGNSNNLLLQLLAAVAVIVTYLAGWANSSEHAIEANSTKS